MNKLYYIVCIILLPASAVAQNDSNVQWSLIFKNSFGQVAYDVTRRGGAINDVNLTYSCAQSPIHIGRDNERNLQEEVIVTCKIGIDSEVSLVQSCIFNRHDQNYSLLKVKDNMYNYTVTLACGS